MQLLKDQDASLIPLAGKTVAVLGYGNQGQAQALNLRDNGIQVIVGNQDDLYRTRAIADGFTPYSIVEAAHAGDILLVLTTDESQPLIWDEQIAPGIKPGKTLVWASGYNVGYGLIQLPADVDVVMVAPRMTGINVRALFLNGSGALAQFAVHQDATGDARATALALCKGIGLTRGGVFEIFIPRRGRTRSLCRAGRLGRLDGLVPGMLSDRCRERIFARIDGDGTLCVR